MGARAACYIADVLHELLKALLWEKNLCIIEGHSFLHYHLS